MTSRLMVRCTEGHPYDRNAHEVCPVCGAAPVGFGGAPSPLPRPEPASRRVVLIAGLVVAVIGSGVLGFYLNRPAKEGSPVVDPGTTSASKTESSPPADAPKIAPKAEAPPSTPTSAPGAELAPDDPRRLAQNLKRPLETDPEATARVTQYMTVDPAIVGSLKRAVSPADAKDVDPLLASFTPDAANVLHLSVLLREEIVNDSSVLAFAAGDMAQAKMLMSVVVSQPPLAPGFIFSAAYKNLAFVLGQKNGADGDAEIAGRLVATAARQGYARGARMLLDRQDIAAAGAVDQPAMQAILKLGVLQEPAMLEAGATQRGIDAAALGATRQAFYSALSRHDWSAAIKAYQSVGEPQIPAFDAQFAHALLFDRNYAAYLDRALVGSVSGEVALYSNAMDALSYFCEFGLDGVVKDAPNAAVWMAIAMAGAPNDPGWAKTRERYGKIKATLTPEQRQALAQLAQQFHWP